VCSRVVGHLYRPLAGGDCGVFARSHQRLPDAAAACALPYSQRGDVWLEPTGDVHGRAGGQRGPEVTCREQLGKPINILHSAPAVGRYEQLRPPASLGQAKKVLEPHQQPLRRVEVAREDGHK